MFLLCLTEVNAGLQTMPSSIWSSCTFQVGVSKVATLNPIQRTHLKRTVQHPKILIALTRPVSEVIILTLFCYSLHIIPLLPATWYHTGTLLKSQWFKWQSPLENQCNSTLPILFITSILRLHAGTTPHLNCWSINIKFSEYSKCFFI